MQTSDMDTPSSSLCQTSAKIHSSDADSFADPAAVESSGGGEREEVRSQLEDKGTSFIPTIVRENHLLRGCLESLPNAAGLLSYSVDAGKERALAYSARVVASAQARLPFPTVGLVPLLTTTTSSRRLGIASTQQALLAAYALLHFLVSPHV